MSAPSTSAPSALLQYDLDRGGEVTGADEAGRGCLAGPIVAAGVRFDYRTMTAADLQDLAKLNDSKKLTPSTRERLFGLVLRHAVAATVVVRSASWIDNHGLHRTNLEILATASDRVWSPGCCALIDGFAVGDAHDSSEAVVKGDATSAAIAAASVLAKVTRDRIMQAAAREFPQYGFASHVGYATKAHQAAIIEHGPTRIHRMSFASAAYQQLALAT